MPQNQLIEPTIGVRVDREVYKKFKATCLAKNERPMEVMTAIMNSWIKKNKSVWKDI